MGLALGAIGWILLHLANVMIGFAWAGAAFVLAAVIALQSGWWLRAGASWGRAKQEFTKDLEDLSGRGPTTLTGVPDWKIPGKRVPSSWPVAGAGALLMALAVWFYLSQGRHPHPWLDAGFAFLVLVSLLAGNGWARQKARRARKNSD